MDTADHLPTSLCVQTAKPWQLTSHVLTLGPLGSSTSNCPILLAQGGSRM
jgi:hypothetical protein